MLLFSTFFSHYSFHKFSTVFPCYCFPHFSHTTLNPHSKFNIFCGIMFSFIRLQQLIDIPSNFSFSFMFLYLMTSLSNIP
jgi:hypothetical protein